MAVFSDSYNDGDFCQGLGLGMVGGKMLELIGSQL